MRLASRGVQEKLSINGIASKVCARWPDMLTETYEVLNDPQQSASSANRIWGTRCTNSVSMVPGIRYGKRPRPTFLATPDHSAFPIASPE